MAADDPASAAEPPVLRDLVAPGRLPSEAAPSAVLDALVDSLYQEVSARLALALEEAEAGLKTTLRAHLEVMLPEVLDELARRRGDPPLESEPDPHT